MISFLFGRTWKYNLQHVGAFFSMNTRGSFLSAFLYLSLPAGGGSPASSRSCMSAIACPHGSPGPNSASENGYSARSPSPDGIAASKEAHPLDDWADDDT